MSNYAALSAINVHGGRFAPSGGNPAWVSSLPTQTWTPIPGATTFMSQATGLLGAGTQWPGTNPIGSIVDAYGDPVIDGTNIYHNGGGHGDGFWNGVLKSNMSTLGMSVEIPAAPGSCYPAGFPNAAWPSGRGVDWMRTLAQHDPADVAFAAPFSSPRQTHEYGGQAVRNALGVPKQIYWFYGAHKIYDFASQMWTNRHELGQDHITQKVAARANIVQAGLGTNIGPSVPLQQGTMALYDALTDKFYVTLIPGDAGGGWRNFFFCYDPAADAVPSIHRPQQPCRESMVWVQAGRYIYGITSLYSVPYPNFTQSQGFRFHIDSGTFEYFTVTGAVPSFSAGGVSPQEATPYWHDANTNKLHGWSHNATDRAGIYTLDIATFGTHGGSGTFTDQYLWPQTRTTLAGTPPSAVSFKYNGVHFIQQYGLAVVFPHSSLPPYAIKM
ncbi:MAG: hypothetical protein HEQ39_09660 [Rhizobacter sp.]